MQVDKQPPEAPGLSYPGRANTVLAGAVIALVAAVSFLFLGDVSNELRGATALAIMLLLMLLGIPVGVAMGVGGLLGIVALSGTTPAAATLMQAPYGAVARWSFSVIPMFIFMGYLLWQARVTESVYRVVRLWFGWLPGGLAVATNFAGAGLSAASGSTLGITYAVSRIGIPEMLAARYDKRMAASAVLMAGTGGQLIPPSIMSVVYAGLASTPVGMQLLAGFVPGVLLAIVYALLIVAIAKIWPHMAPRPELSEPIPMRVKLRQSVDVWPIPTLMFIILGGLYAGLFTATEAGAVGALGALLLAALRLNLREFRTGVAVALRRTVSGVASLLFLLVGAALLNRVLALSGLANAFVAFIEELGFGRIGFMLCMLALYLILGMFMDSFTMLVITIPILLPSLHNLDIGLLGFGAFVVLLGELAVVTPPVGILTFVVHGICQDPEVNSGQTITLGDVFQGALWFIPVSVGVLLLMIVWPDIAEWLPRISAAQ